MKRGNRLVVALAAGLLMAAGLSACGDDETTRPACTYWGNDTPENVVKILISSYRDREFSCYRQLLHPQFRFYFQERHVPAGLDRPYWTAAEDSAATHTLFTAEEVTDIYVDLTFVRAVPDTLERSPEEVMFIRVTPMKLTIDDRDGTTYLVEGDIQDLYFRRGEGADSTNWYLYEWHDIPGGGGVGAPGHEVPPTAVEFGSWGRIKALFWDGVIREDN